ncbi:MAG: polyprenyl synthetase family protein, partial [Gammaproteobacteria bacterium]|nr:polyprenyl synthetase family protein [Gammaproteobacteria bacterium]
EVALINQIGSHIINSGGKRLRPIIHLLCAKALAYEGSQHIDLSAIIEFIHTATLLHDDVVDNSDLRRGEDTANALWGNAASVLVGDFLYSRAFEMMVEIDRMTIMAILSKATNTIAEGEVLQLLNCHDPDTTEERYLEVIHNKTAKLFESASELAAVICDRPPEQQQAMAKYGMHLGCAFQLIDDVLDYTSSAEDMGKNLGDDLSEGKPTLPLIYAMRNGSSVQATMIREAIENGGLDKIEQIHDAIHNSGAIEYTSNCAKNEAKLAIESLNVLTDSAYKDALIFLANFSVNRNH